VRDELDDDPRPEPEPPECTACGVCCFSTLDRYVSVSGDDYARLGDEAERLVHFIENRAYMHIANGHCAGLAIDPVTERFTCTVYDHRPTICRELDRGSPACAGERATKADRRPALLRLGARKA
jgi:Fe-S-cluster containining protein